MDGIIRVTANERGEGAVSARELHAFLESKRRFADWIKERVRQYGFVEGRDFALASRNSEASHGGHNRIEYAITLEMAKELSMVERNEKGRRARQYFIECERRLRESARRPVADLLSDPDLIIGLATRLKDERGAREAAERAAAGQRETIAGQRAAIEEQRPRALFARAVES